jgi:hypothetical protein
VHENEGGEEFAEKRLLKLGGRYVGLELYPRFGAHSFPAATVFRLEHSPDEAQRNSVVVQPFVRGASH